MHNIKDLRKNFENFKNLLKNRNVELDLDLILKLDEKNRDLIEKKEKLEKEKKEISKSKDKSLFAKSKELSVKIEDLSKKQGQTQDELDNILSSLPNLPLDDVPIGEGESSNKEIKKFGNLPQFDFKPKSHTELGNNLNMLDFDLATKTTGSRFVFVKDKLALLERALSNFMLDIHTKVNGYKEISPPLIASDNTMFGTGQLPKFENDQFEIKFDDNGSVFTNPIALTSNFTADENVRNVHDIPGYGLIIVYDSESWLTGRKVKLMAVDYEGNVLEGWSDGINVCDVDSNQDYLDSVTTDQGVFIIWNDGRGDGDDIYGQMIDINGNLLGNSIGEEIAVYDSYQQNPSIAYNDKLSHNEVLICWEDYVNNSYYDISCKAILTSTLYHSPNIQLANTVNSNQINPFVYTTLDGSYLITWQDSRNYAGTVAPNDDIYLQKLTSDGIAFEQNGISVCNADFSQNNPQIELYDESLNSYLIYWNDLRSSGKADLVNIYAQSITINDDSSCLSGDVSGDGVINVVDVISTVNHIIGNSMLEGEAFCSADLNDDGIINVTDIISLINIILS